MFQNLESNKNYSISVTMRNGVGEGPPAVTYIMTTPEPAGTSHRIKLSNDHYPKGMLKIFFVFQ